MARQQKHPNKDIEKALKAAENAGWTVTPKASGHNWGEMKCGSGCRASIWSTPKSPTNHAKQIARAVSKCPH
ncbi:MAG TPA: hypothetical protein VFU33_06945 [Gaiellaceae bacterium]|nr:hypothetical protein [Gaiellaceae bacterium]